MKGRVGPIHLMFGLFVFWLLAVSLTEDIAGPLTGHAALYAVLIGGPAAVAYGLGKRSVVCALEENGARHCAATDDQKDDHYR